MCCQHALHAGYKYMSHSPAPVGGHLPSDPGRPTSCRHWPVVGDTIDGCVLCDTRERWQVTFPRSAGGPRAFACLRYFEGGGGPVRCVAPFLRAPLPAALAKPRGATARGPPRIDCPVSGDAVPTRPPQPSGRGCGRLKWSGLAAESRRRDDARGGRRGFGLRLRWGLLAWLAGGDDNWRFHGHGRDRRANRWHCQQ